MDDSLDDFLKNLGSALGDKTLIKRKTAQPDYDFEPILERMRSGVSGQESGGNTRAVNPRTSATGEFQVMPANIPVWTRNHLGQSLSVEEFKANPQAQEQVFRGEMGKYLKKALRNTNGDEDMAIRQAAAAWYGGEGAMHRFDDPTRFRANEPSFKEYTESVLRRIKGAKSEPPATLNDFLGSLNNALGAQQKPNTDLGGFLGELDKITGSVPPTPTNPVNPAPLSEDAQRSIEPNFYATNPDEKISYLTSYRQTVADELVRAKTTPRRKILQTRLAQMDAQLKAAQAEKAAAPTPTNPAPLATPPPSLPPEMPIETLGGVLVGTENAFPAATAQTPQTISNVANPFAYGNPNEKLPADYEEFLKASELTDSQESRNAYADLRRAAPESFQPVPQAQTAQSQQNLRREKPAITATPAEVKQAENGTLKNPTTLAPGTYDNLQKEIVGTNQFKKIYKTKPTAAEAYSDNIQQSYGTNGQAALDVYRNLTGKSLLAPAESLQADIDAYYDPKTKVYEQPNQPVYADVARIVEAYNKNGEQGIKDLIASGEQTKADVAEGEVTQQQRNNDFELRQKVIGEITAERAAYDDPVLAANPGVAASTPPEMSEAEIQKRVDLYKSGRIDDETRAQFEKNAEWLNSNAGKVLDYANPLFRYLSDETKNNIASSAVGGYFNSVGGVYRTLTGVARPFSGSAYQLLSKVADKSETLGSKTGAGDFTSEVFKIAGSTPIDIAKLMLVSKLPGGIVVGMGVDSALQSAGRGESASQILRAGQKGAAEGGVFEAAPIAGRVAENLGRNAVSKAIAREGATLAVIGGGTVAVELIDGTPTEQAIKKGVVSGLFHLTNVVGSGLLGKTVRGSDKDDNTVTVKVSPDGKVKELKGEVKNPDIEMVINATTGVYEAKSKTQEQPFNPVDKNGALAQMKTRLLGGAKAQESAQIENRIESKGNLLADETVPEAAPIVAKLTETNSPEVFRELTEKGYTPAQAGQLIETEMQARESLKPDETNTAIEEKPTSLAKAENVSVPENAKPLSEKVEPKTSNSSRNPSEITSDLREQSEEKPTNTGLVENEPVRAVSEKPEKLTPIQESVIKRDLAKGLTPEAIAEKRSVAVEQIQTVQPLAEKGEHGKMSSLLRNDDFAGNPDVQKALGIDLKEAATNKSGAMNLVMDTIAKDLGKPRSSHISPNEYGRWLDGNAHKIPETAVAKVESALLNHSDWSKRRDAFRDDPKLNRFLGNVEADIDLGKIKTFSDLKPISKRAIINLAKENYGISEQTAKDGFNRAIQGRVGKGNDRSGSLETGENPNPESASQARRDAGTQKVDAPIYSKQQVENEGKLLAPVRALRSAPESQLLPKAEIKIDGNVIRANAAATELIRRASNAEYGRDAGYFTGFQLTPAAITRVARALENAYGGERFIGSAGMSAKILLKKFNEAATAGGAKGVRLAVTSPEFPEGLKTTNQEESGHEAIGVSGVELEVNEILSEPSVQESLNNLQSGYKNQPLSIQINEVMAKSLREDAEAELNLPSNKIDENLNALAKAMDNQGIDLDKVAAEFENISPRGKEFAKNVRERNNQRARTNGETNTGGTGEISDITKNSQATRDSGNLSRPTKTDNPNNRVTGLQQGSLHTTNRSGNESLVKPAKDKEGNPLAPHAKPLNAFQDANGDINLEKLYNKDGEFDYETVKNVAGKIRDGELEIARLNPREEQGRIAGGRRNVEASVIIGAEARTNQADARGGRPTRKEKLAHNGRVEAHLEKYAKNEGIWFDYPEFVSNHKYLAKGEEAHVYEDKDIEFVVKAVDYDFSNHGISPLDFIDNRISLHNYLFPATKYELTGFTRDNDGRFRFILRQPFIDGKEVHPSTRKAYMKRVLGADSEALTPEQYTNSDYHIWDLHLKNLLQSKNGEVFVIDALLELNTPERYLNGTRTYKDFGIASAGESSSVRDEILYAKAANSDKMTFGDYAIDVANMAKSFKSTGDLSAAGRQGWMLTLTHPMIAKKAFWNQLKSLSETRHKTFVRDLNLHPFVEMAEDSGLFLSNLSNESSITEREEAFMSQILGDEEFFKNTKAEMVRRGITFPVRAAERAYTTYLDSLRIDSFALFAKQIHQYNQRKGIDQSDVETYASQMKAVADFVNNATGRGDLGKFNDAAPVLNATFFSARYWKSRLQIMNPLFYARMPKGARGLALKNLAGFAGGTAALILLWKLGGGDLEWNDPNDPDTLKLKWGNYSYDVTGGMVSHLRYVARMGLAFQDKDTGGKMLNLSQRYVRSKLAPVPAGAWNALTGKNYIGEPTSWKEEALELPKPILLGSFYEAAKDGGSLGLIKTMPEFFGIGATRFKSEGEIRKRIEEERKALAGNPPKEARIEAARRIKLWENLLKQTRKGAIADAKKTEAGKQKH